LEGLLGAFGVGAFKEAVLRRLLGFGVTDFAGGGNPHALEPGFDKQPMIEGQPYQSAYFVWVGVVPNSHDHLRDGGILEM
jgi:hypothetical protein